MEATVLCQIGLEKERRWFRMTHRHEGDAHVFEVLKCFGWENVLSTSSKRATRCLLFILASTLCSWTCSAFIHKCRVSFSLLFIAKLWKLYYYLEDNMSDKTQHVFVLSTWTERPVKIWFRLSDTYILDFYFYFRFYLPDCFNPKRLRSKEWIYCGVDPNVLTYMVLNEELARYLLSSWGLISPFSISIFCPSESSFNCTETLLVDFMNLGLQIHTVTFTRKISIQAVVTDTGRRGPIRSKKRAKTYSINS